jgi:hypothetical protein
MTESGLSKILYPEMPDPIPAEGIPRRKLYWKFSNTAIVIHRIQSAWGG